MDSLDEESRDGSCCAEDGLVVVASFFKPFEVLSESIWMFTSSVANLRLEKLN